MGAEASAPRFNTAEFAGTFRGPLNKKYEILRQLGAGAQGAAYLVRHKEGGAEFVAKETHDMTPEGKEEFKAEFAKMRDLHHPNCTKIIELVEGKDIIDGEWKEQLFVISELARGSDLYKYMRKAINSDTALTEEWIAGVYGQAMQGVAYIHSRGIVHNDLKPDNILMLDDFDPGTPNRVPKVVINDFGCATLASDTFFRAGDLRYQSPESWRVIQLAVEGKDTSSSRKLDPKADVWAMGATLFELLSGGLLPFLYRPCTMDDIVNTEGVMDELRDAILQQPIRIHPHCGGASTEVCDLLQRIFQKEPAARPTSAEVLQHGWFGIKGRVVSPSVQWGLEFKATKGIAHRILLNALSTKLQRDHYEDCWRIFQETDSNQSGLIGLEEFTAACGKIGKDAADSEQLFRQADIDEDGQLDFNEFMAMTFDWQSLDTAALMANVRKLFEDLDIDGTGDVDEKELSIIFQNMLSPDELREVFQNMDEDGNSRISVRELMKFLFEPATDKDLERYAARRSCRQQAVSPSAPLANSERGSAPRQSTDPTDASFCCGVVMPAAVCLCVSYHGLIKLF